MSQKPSTRRRRPKTRTRNGLRSSSPQIRELLPTVEDTGMFRFTRKPPVDIRFLEDER